jgi:hypothetical protein
MLPVEQHHDNYMCDALFARIPMERKLEVRPAQTEEGGHGHKQVSEDGQILIGQAPRVSANANVMPVNSGRVEDEAPTTATLRWQLGSPRDESRAHHRPMSMLSLRESSVATPIQGYPYALPTGPYAASQLHGSAESIPSAEA